MRSKSGVSRSWFAWRTGPVTARIDEVAAPDEEQHHGDLVAFDAAPLNGEELRAARAADGGEGSRQPLSEYSAFRVVTPGNYRAFELDGFAPSAESLELLKQALVQLGVVWEQRSG